MKHLLCLALLLTPLRANLLVNGDFEAILTPPIANNSTLNLNSGSTGIPGWTVVGSSCAPCVQITKGITADFGPFVQYISQEATLDPSSFQHIDLVFVNFSPHVSGIEQTVALTIGQTYNLSFWVSRGASNHPSYATPASVDVLINGVSQAPPGTFTNAVDSIGVKQLGAVQLQLRCDANQQHDHVS